MVTVQVSELFEEAWDAVLLWLCALRMETPLARAFKLNGFWMEPSGQDGDWRIGRRAVWFISAGYDVKVEY